MFLSHHQKRLPLPLLVMKSFHPDSLLERVLERGLFSSLPLRRARCCHGRLLLALEILRDLGSGAGSHEGSSGAVEVDMPVDIPVGRLIYDACAVPSAAHLGGSVSGSGTPVSVLSGTGFKDSCTPS